MSQARVKLFDEVYTQHIAIVWKTAHAFALSKEDRDDLFQEILVSLWEALPNFEARAKLSTYVYRIAHRRALNWKRTRQRYAHKLALYERDLPALAPSDPDTQARLDWLYRSITACGLSIGRSACFTWTASAIARWRILSA